MMSVLIVAVLTFLSLIAFYISCYFFDAFFIGFTFAIMSGSIIFLVVLLMARLAEHVYNYKHNVTLK